MVLSKYADASTVEQKSSVVVELLQIPRAALLSVRGGRKKSRYGRQVAQQVAAVMRQLQQVRESQQQPQQQQDRGSNSEINQELSEAMDTSDDDVGNQEQRNHPGDESVRRVNRAAELVREGYLGRAAKQLMPSMHAPATERTIDQLDGKHLQRQVDQQELPAVPQDSPYILQIESETWKRAVKELDNGSSAGLSGLNGAHIKAMVGNSSICSEQLKRVVIDMLNGVFVACPAEEMLSAVRVIPFLKRPDQPSTSSIRDIKIEEVIVKLADKVGHCPAAQAITAQLNTIQMGVGKQNGVEAAVHIIRDTAEWFQNRPGSVIVQLDAEHAFGTIRRKKVLEHVLQSEAPEIKRVRRYLAWKLGHTNHSVYYGPDSNIAACFRSNEGLLQGSPWGSILYSMTVQPAYEQALAGTSAQAVAIHDDYTVMGTLEDAITVTNQLQQHLAPLGVRLNRDKTVVYHPAGQMTQQQIQQLLSAGLPHADRALLEVLGAAVSMDDALVSEWAKQQVRGHDEMLALLTHVAMPRQIAMLLLRSCTLPRFGYLQRVMKPEAAREAMEMWQQRMEDKFMQIADISRDEATPNLITSIKMPIKAGGCGMGDATVTSNAAFVASVAASATTILQYRQQNGNNSAVLERDISRALEWLSARQVNSLTTRGALPTADQPFLEHMNGHGNATKLQLLIVTAHAINVTVTAAAQETPQDRARINSTSAKYASVWMTTAPTEKDYELSDQQCTMAFRMRLGLAQVRGGPGPSEVARHANVGWGISARHEQVKRALARIANEGGALGQVEVQVNSGTRADLLLHLAHQPGISVFVDVMVTNPSAHLQAAQRQLGAASVGELRKRERYQGIINPQTQRIMPFVVEMYGAIGTDAISVLQALAEQAERAQRISKIEYMMRAIATISIAIQRGNAELMIHSQRRI
jgi:hypothetical protein